ncbi:MAG: acetyl-CoA carboxylase biotin carboxyl carrier protein [Limnothrix sp.]
MAINLQDIQELLTTIGQTNVTEFELKTDNFELRVSKGTVVTAAPVIYQEQSAMPMPPVLSQPSTPAPAAAAPTNEVASPGIDPKWVEVTSPMVGTFYRAPAPGEDPFISVGDHVNNGDTVCIIEAMKLMNEIETEASGEVVKIAVEDGDPIEFGQTLMWVSPS